MAKRGDPAVLRFVVLWLRAFARWNQTQLAESCGAFQADVSRWEQGLEAPSEERLRRMAAAAGVPWLVVALLRRVFAGNGRLSALQGGLMKKKTRKLVLAKETLRNLERENLDLMVGATYYTADCVSAACVPSGPTNCGTARQKVSCQGC